MVFKCDWLDPNVAKLLHINLSNQSTFDADTDAVIMKSSEGSDGIKRIVRASLIES